MSIVAWIVLGLLAGFIGSKLVNKRGEGLILDMILGVLGAIAGGGLFDVFGATGLAVSNLYSPALNVYSLLVAVVGAIVVLLLYHVIRATYYAIHGPLSQ